MEDLATWGDAEKVLEPVVTEYTLCPLPDDHIDHHLFAVELQRRPGDRWVIHRMSEFLDDHGRWSYGSHYTDEWRAAHWHTFDDAVRLARTAIPAITVNGRTVADVVELHRLKEWEAWHTRLGAHGCDPATCAPPVARGSVHLIHYTDHTAVCDCPVGDDHAPEATR